MSATSPLSPRQRQLVETIETLTASRGFPPSMSEAAVAMGLHRSRVAQLAESAAKKGAIAREPRAARSWRVVKTAQPKARR